VADVLKTIVCPLWDINNHRFRARRYTAWTRKCYRCGRDLAVADSLKRQADSEDVRFVCEQCALIREST